MIGQKYDATDRDLGGYVFHKGGYNYLFAAGLDGGCAAGSSLYLVNSVDDLQVIELTPGSACVELGGSPVKVSTSTTYMTGPAGFFLYANVTGTKQIYRVEGSGADLDLAQRWEAPAGIESFRFFSIDTKNARAASSDYYGGVIGIWDLTIPSSPALLYEIPAAVVASLCARQAPAPRRRSPPSSAACRARHAPGKSAPPVRRSSRPLSGAIPRCRTTTVRVASGSWTTRCRLTVRRSF